VSNNGNVASYNELQYKIHIYFECDHTYTRLEIHMGGEDLDYGFMGYETV
jgi:hypothetical protein